MEPNSKRQILYKLKTEKYGVCDAGCILWSQKKSLSTKFVRQTLYRIYGMFYKLVNYI